MPRRAYSYIRFSNLQQMRGDSKRRQAEFARRLCAEHGWTLDDSLDLHDLGVSAFRGKNAEVGALSIFLDAVHSGRVSGNAILIIENIDRLSRNKVGEALQLFIRLLTQGITIVTANPERIYTRDSINDIATLLEPLIYMSRAHDESMTKSKRVREAWAQRKKQALADGRPLWARPPAWIANGPDGYRLIPERTEAVRAIFRMAATQGLGTWRIVQELAADPQRYPPMGLSTYKGKPRDKRWSVGYVNRILRNRAVLGEYQPCASDPETGDVYPDGDPIPGYYPAAVSEAEFYQAHAAIRSRKGRSGRAPRRDRNLFTGLVVDAIDRVSMQLRLCRPGDGKYCYDYLVSASATHGRRSSASARWAHGVEYGAFEGAVLALIEELSSADVRDRAAGGPDAHEEEIRALTESLVALDHKQRMYQERAADPKTPPSAVPAYLDMMEEASRGRAVAAARLQELKEDASTGTPEVLGELQSLVKLLGEAEEGEQVEIRRKLRGRLRLLLEEIRVVIEKGPRQRRTVHIKLYLRNGGERYTTIETPVGRGCDLMEPLPLKGEDFRAEELQDLLEALALPRPDVIRDGNGM